jgi:tetratricopeptide (TPR) repeat protein
MPDPKTTGHSPATIAAEKFFAHGVAAQDRRAYPEAIAAYQKVLALDAGHFAATCNLAMVFHELEQAGAAYRLYREAIRLNPSQALPYIGIGDLKFAENYPEEALAFYHQACRLSPESAKIRHNIGIIERNRLNSDKAIEAFMQAIRRQPDYPSALENLLE